MEEREQKSGGGVGCFVAAIVGLLLPVLYVLGIGPASWCTQTYPRTNDFLETMYTPIIFLADKFEPVSDVLEWYFGLFE